MAYIYVHTCVVIVGAVVLLHFEHKAGLWAGATLQRCKCENKTKTNYNNQQKISAQNNNNKNGKNKYTNSTAKTNGKWRCARGECGDRRERLHKRHGTSTNASSSSGSCSDNNNKNNNSSSNNCSTLKSYSRIQASSRVAKTSRCNHKSNNSNTSQPRVSRSRSRLVWQVAKQPARINHSSSQAASQRWWIVRFEHFGSHSYSQSRFVSGSTRCGVIALQKTLCS